MIRNPTLSLVPMFIFALPLFAVAYLLSLVIN